MSTKKLKRVDHRNWYCNLMGHIALHISSLSERAVMTVALVRHAAYREKVDEEGMEIIVSAILSAWKSYDEAVS